MNTIALLNDFRRNQSDEAFATLTHRYVNLVFSVALRRLNDSALAENATQMVFARLAGAPPVVTTESELLGWLHHTSLHVALDLSQPESCRINADRTAASLDTGIAERDPRWTELAPQLDEAIENLSPTERQAVLMKYFQDNSHHNIGSKLAGGISEDTSKIHTSRALERLRVTFSAKGIICTAGLLTKLLTAHAIETPPANLVARLTSLPQPQGGGADATTVPGDSSAGWRSKFAAFFRRNRSKGVGQ